MKSLSSKKFSSRLLKWFDQHGRHDLPWQKNINPYRVWVSEIMLQQTQVTTVIPYYNRFMKKFPSISALANATEDEVLHLWTGLGYYARARNLHKAAKIIRDDHKAKFPGDFAKICALPGIGRSTAGAILSIAFQQRAPILDGNVRRVLCRLQAIEGVNTDKNVQQQLWELAEHYTPNDRIADYTQAIMDLGATLCKRSKPDCIACPFANVCIAHQQGREADFPQAKPSKTLPIKKTKLILLRNQHDQILLEKRPPYGIWGGLWSVPEYHENTKNLPQWCEQQYACRKLSKAINLPNFRHTFSHFHLDISPIILSVEPDTNLVMEADQRVWYNIHQPDNRGLAAPIKKLLEDIAHVDTFSVLPKTA